MRRLWTWVSIMAAAVFADAASGALLRRGQPAHSSGQAMAGDAISRMVEPRARSTQRLVRMHAEGGPAMVNVRFVIEMKEVEQEGVASGIVPPAAWSKEGKVKDLIQ